MSIEEILLKIAPPGITAAVLLLAAKFGGVVLENIFKLRQVLVADKTLQRAENRSDRTQFWNRQDVLENRSSFYALRYNIVMECFAQLMGEIRFLNRCFQMVLIELRNQPLDADEIIKQIMTMESGLSSMTKMMDDTASEIYKIKEKNGETNQSETEETKKSS